jgi:AraC-like DNA-binding protein
VIILLSLTAPSPHPDRSGPPPAGGMFDGERPHPPMDFGRRPHGEPRPPSDGNFFREGDRGPGFPLPEHRPDGKKSCATGVMLIYFAAYSFVIIFRIRKKSRNAEGKYHWLLWIAAAFPVIFFAVLFPAVFDFWNGPGHSSIGMGSALYIILFGFFALKYGVHDQDVNPEEKTGRYEKSGLKGNGVENIIRRIENLMQTEKPYLDPDLSIIAVARRLNIPKHHLTQSLNSGLSKNFYAYINEYRVREAVQRMKSAEFVSCSIIRIAYDCGFNSKSTFNNIFKKIMGQTPSEYRSSCGVRGNPDSGG